MNITRRRVLAGTAALSVALFAVVVTAEPSSLAVRPASPTTTAVALLTIDGPAVIAEPASRGIDLGQPEAEDPPPTTAAVTTTTEPERFIEVEARAVADGISYDDALGRVLTDLFRYHAPDADRTTPQNEVDDLYWAWRLAGWSDADSEHSWHLSSAVVCRESLGHPGSRNGALKGGTWGLFQISKASWRRHLANAGIVTSWDYPADGSAPALGNIFDPLTNMTAALWIVDHYGWRQWKGPNPGRCDWPSYGKRLV